MMHLSSPSPPPLPPPPKRYKNYHVSATELESLLQTHPAVRESLAYGVEDPKVMELVAMDVVLKQGCQVSD